MQEGKAWYNQSQTKMSGKAEIQSLVELMNMLYTSFDVFLTTAELQRRNKSVWATKFPVLDN